MLTVQFIQWTEFNNDSSNNQLYESMVKNPVATHLQHSTTVHSINHTVHIVNVLDATQMYNLGIQQLTGGQVYRLRRISRHFEVN